MMTPGMRFAGGMNVYLRDIATTMSLAGMTVDVFTRNHHAGGPEVLHIAADSRIIHLPAGAPELVKSEVVPYLGEYRDNLLRFVESEGQGYDLVHSHYWLSGAVGEAVARRWGVPYVVSFHTLAAIKERESSEIEPEQRKLAEARMADQADLAFAFTEGERHELNQLFDIPLDRTHVAPGGVDLSLFFPADPGAARRRLGFGQDERISLFVGRPEPFKGPDVLIKALAHIRDRSQERVVLVGGSEGEHSFDWLRVLAAELGVADRVTWRTAVPQQDLVDYYAASDICVVPSFHETFGLVALEAQACGRPVVAASVGALTTQVVDGETGLLVASHSPEDFARCINQLMDSPGLRERMGEAGVHHAQTFTWEQAAERALAGYSQAARREMRQGAVRVR
jgi:D-inositol-3-phosphate glycosyltransferase